MFIRIGYEIVIDSKADTVLILALSPHSNVTGRDIGSAAVQADPEQPMEPFLDSFDNRLTRLRAPAGRLTLWSDCVVELWRLAPPVGWVSGHPEITPPSNLHHCRDAITATTRAFSVWPRAPRDGRRFPTVRSRQAAASESA